MHHYPASSRQQSGATLIELMIGIAIGLMTIAVAMGALMASRGASGTITDANDIQQQASHAFRVIGQQLRQAGSLRLNLAPQKNPGDPIEITDPVAFETKTSDFNPATDTISGMDSPGSGEFKLISSYRNYTEKSFSSATPVSLLRDCLGEQSSAKPTIIQNRFFLDTSKNEIHCNGQPLVGNVAEFEVRYILQADAATGSPTLQYVDATTAASNWSRIFGAEICLVLFGKESISMPNGSSYTACDGSNVNISPTGTLAASRKNKMHMLFRSVFQLRSQGLIGAAS